MARTRSARLRNQMKQHEASGGAVSREMHDDAECMLRRYEKARRLLHLPGFQLSPYLQILLKTPVVDNVVAEPHAAERVLVAGG